MREIKFIGNMKLNNDARNYQYSIFECPICNEHVIRKTKDGLKQKYCCHKCYASMRGKRGAYKDCVFISGYKYIYSPEHPNTTQSGYVAEHRLIGEKIIGRYLNNDEVVHHINFNKTDNREENLKVMSFSEHSKLHQSLKRRDIDGKFKI